MIHKHHIIPTHRGGSDDPSNIVSLSPTQHSMWHWAEYFLWGIEWDRIAAKGLAGQINNEEINSLVWKEAGKKGGSKGGPKTYELGVGVHGLSTEQRKINSRKAGLANGGKGGKKSARGVKVTSRKTGKTLIFKSQGQAANQLNISDASVSRYIQQTREHPEFIFQRISNNQISQNNL
jgi:hypothetical protein